MRAGAGTSHVGGGAVDRHGENDDGRLVEGRPDREGAAKHERLGMGILKRELHYSRTSKRAWGKGRPLTAMTGPERSKHRGFRPASVSRALTASALTSSGSAIVASAWTETCSASVASLPQLRASSRLEPDAPPKCGTSVTICSAYRWPPMRSSKNSACTLAWLMKFFGVPPPRTTDAVRGWRITRLADSMMSPMTSMWPAVGTRCRACDSPMPIEESAIAGQKT